MSHLIGCIADDFTGATDFANTLVGNGLTAIQWIGVPDADTDLGTTDAVVIALKTRTAPRDDAVARSLAAYERLKQAGVEQVVLKICSTFDSTADGNIGPVADALLEASGADLTLTCPAFPATGRTVYMGHLFVFDKLLEHSPMRDHPLTPMRQSDLVALLAAQSDHPVALISRHVLRGPLPDALARIAELNAGGARHLILDAVDANDLRQIGRIAAALGRPPLIGASGIALGIAGTFSSGTQAITATPPPPRPTRRAILAGSCSEATRAQLARITDCPTFQVDPLALAEGCDVAAEAVAWAGRQPNEATLVIRSSDEPGAIAKIQDRLGRTHAGEMVEACFGAIAQALTDGSRVGGRPVDALIVAGGETSGAIVAALGIEALEIGPEIAPGVPWTSAHFTGAADRRMALTLKSGNFGGEDFFAVAWRGLDAWTNAPMAQPTNADG